MPTLAAGSISAPLQGLRSHFSMTQGCDRRSAGLTLGYLSAGPLGLRFRDLVGFSWRRVHEALRNARGFRVALGLICQGDIVLHACIALRFMHPTLTTNF